MGAVSGGCSSTDLYVVQQWGAAYVGTPAKVCWDSTGVLASGAAGKISGGWELFLDIFAMSRSTSACGRTQIEDVGEQRTRARGA